MGERFEPGELAAIEARLNAASGLGWKLAPRGQPPAITVRLKDGRRQTMRVTRESEPAGLGDVTFVAHSRADIGRLLAALHGEGIPSEIELLAMAKRVREASPGPWREFLESDPGMGGDSVIRVSDSDDEPDLYLWVDDSLAPEADFAFVAHARQDLPKLLDAVVRQESSAQGSPPIHL